jgi:small-conductance mechanosensitive channel
MELLDNNWFTYGILLMICIPLLVVAINEVTYFARKKNKQFTAPLNTFKNIILPLVALSIVFTQVLEYPRSSTLMKLLETFIWILIINVLLALVNVIFFSGKGSKRNKTKVPQLFLDIFRVVMVLFGAAIVLSMVWGADLGGLVTALGLGSFVIGLALQDTLGNLFSGIALVYEKPFSEGDYIEVEDQRGKVIEMNWRAIRMETREKELIVIPHLVIGQGTIKNYSRPTSVHIMKTEIGFSHQNPPNKVKEALLSTCCSTPGILHDPEPEVKTNEYMESKVVYEVEFAIGNYKDHEEIMDDFMSRVWYTSRRHDLVMPMSQMKIHHAHQMTDVEKYKLNQLENSLKKLPQMLPIEKGNVSELIDGSEIQYFGKGEKVIRQGDPTGSLYVILEGKANLEIANSNNEMVVIGKLEQGDFFGEIAVFTEKFSSFSVKAQEDLKVISVSQNEVLEMVELNPRLAEHLDEMMDARRSKINELSS